MSELINVDTGHVSIRWKLLTGVSVIALGAYISSANMVRAEDADHPQVWIEVGGQADRLGDTAEIFSPPFFADTPEADLAPMVKAQKPSPYSLGLEGKISFTPKDSDWVLSVAARYGRSDASRHEHQQTPLPYVQQFFLVQVLPQPGHQQFGDGQSDLKESHFVLDFQAGKDIGIGLFGAQGSSIVSAGVRFAQFTESSAVSLNARPYDKLGAVHSLYFTTFISSPPPGHYGRIGVRGVDQFRHTYAATAQSRRSVLGVGPSVSWNASLPVAGNKSDMTVDFDWGLNAAVLFGRQRSSVHHKTSGHQFSRTGLPYVSAVQHTGGYAHGPYSRTNSQRVTIPNVGGFAGMSLQFPNAKVSFGYRADVFFGAIDGGIDTVKSQDRSFYGPFATISIGLGG